MTTARRGALVPVVLALACAHAAPRATLVRAAVEPLSAASARELAHCVTDGYACLAAARITPLATLEEACAKGVSGACVSRLVAQLEGPTLIFERDAFVATLTTRCGLGEIAACGLAVRYRGERAPPPSISFGERDDQEPPHAVRLQVPTPLPSEAVLERACRPRWEPMSCADERDRHTMLQEQCTTGHLLACAEFDEYRSGSLFGRAERKQPRNTDRRAACEAGLHFVCPQVAVVGEQPSAPVEPDEGEESYGREDESDSAPPADDGVPPEWRLERKKRLRGHCANGDAAACEALLTFSEPVSCEEAHAACSRFACSERLVETLRNCARKQPDWKRNDPLLARLDRVRTEQRCQDGSAADCLAAATRLAEEPTAFATNPASALTFAKLGCGWRSKPSCELQAKLEAKPFPPAPPRLRVAFVARRDPRTGLPLDVEQRFVDTVRADLIAIGRVRGWELIPSAEVDAALARTELPADRPCDVDCVLAIDGALHPMTVVTLLSTRYKDRFDAVSLTLARMDATPTKLDELELEAETEAGLRRAFAHKLEALLVRSQLAGPAALRDEAEEKAVGARWFHALSAGSRQSEAMANLKAAYTHQKAFFQERDTYSTSVRALGYEPDPGNRYAYFFSGSGPIALRDRSAPADTSEALVGIGVDTREHPGASPASVGDTGCPVTDGPVGLRTTGGEPRFVVLAAANLDADPEFDCWSIASFTRRGPDGKPNPAGEPLHERADVSPADQAAVQRLMTSLVLLRFGIAHHAQVENAVPASLASLATWAAARELHLPEAIPECDALEYQRLDATTARLSCPAAALVMSFARTSAGIVAGMGGSDATLISPFELEEIRRRLQEPGAAPR